MDFLWFDFLGTPAWMWLTFIAIVITLLALDLGLLHKESREIGIRESFMLSAFYMSLGLAFGGWIWFQSGQQAGLEYLTGFVVEKSLAMDNIFVIAMIFGYFSIPRQYQHRVLLWGILGVIVLRGVMIAAGASIVENYHWVLYFFAAFLVFTGVKMLLTADHDYDVAANPVLKYLRQHLPVTETLREEHFFVREADKSGKLRTFVTPLFLALVMVELADVIFAVDSIPAIFAITTDPFIVFTSNIFAILGLRALYFLMADVADRFHLLKYGLAMVLTFIGAKMLIAPWYHVPVQASLAIVAVLIGASVAASLIATRKPST